MAGALTQICGGRIPACMQVTMEPQQGDTYEKSCQTDTASLHINTRALPGSHPDHHHHCIPGGAPPESRTPPKNWGALSLVGPRVPRALGPHTQGP